jgi:nucleotide-binding universal stress UspA family protein
VLPLALALCDAFGASILLTHVVDSRMVVPATVPTIELPSPTELQDAANKLLAEVASKCGDVKVETEVVTGVPHREIVTSTEQDGVDLVILSTHGRTGLAHAVLGSTTEKVVRTAGCPVMTFRPERMRQTSAQESAEPTPTAQPA